jgi:hypothetical protein
MKAFIRIVDHLDYSKMIFEYRGFTIKRYLQNSSKKVWQDFKTSTFPFRRLTVYLFMV